MRLRLLVSGLVAVFALLTAGCTDSSGGSATSGEVQRLTVEMSELKYEPVHL